MRYIDTTEFSPTQEWLQQADQVTAALKVAADAEERRKLLKKYESLWTEQKLNLSSISCGKCWYCESKQVRSDNAVDHFRPKSRVKDVKAHGGYWWLAFDWENYRYTCTYCNSLRKSATTSGGKQDFFPLQDEKKRAYNEKDNHKREVPVLLDPTRTLDFWLLAFAEDGSVGPTVDREKDPFNYERAINSIERYHLMHPDLVQQRVVRLKEVTRWVKEADEAQKLFDQTGEGSARDSAENRIRDIRRRLLPEAEYSMAVKHLLAGMVSSGAARKALMSQ
jgi:5-methylcytosine-specific restriction endonuclease McrA